MRRLVVGLVALTGAINASAWNNSGHMQVALVAWQQLDGQSRSKLVEVLKKHPQFADKFELEVPPSVKAADRDEWFFVHAATWPDMIRRNPQYHHATWHYVNIPLFLDGDSNPDGLRLPNLNPTFEPGTPDKKLNALEALDKELAQLKSQGTDAGDRAIALCWVEHIVGDLHQPLHTTALFSHTTFSGGDHGGNSIHFGSSNLHSKWDEAAGVITSFTGLTRRIDKLRAKGESIAKAASAAGELSPAKWADEGRQICEEFVYSDELLAEISEADDAGDEGSLQCDAPDAEYWKHAHEIADQRILIAGYRLANVLKASLAN